VWSTERVDGHTRAARCCLFLAISLSIVAAGCGRGEAGTSAKGTIATTNTPSSLGTASAASATAQPGRTAADDVLSIESNTQAHVGQLAIGAGNFWEDEYTPPGEAPRRGLTAGIWLTYRDDPAQNRHLRVHPGQEIVVPGYHLRVISIESRIVRVAIRGDGP
jgi:hypothetical protein